MPFVPSARLPRRLEVNEPNKLDIERFAQLKRASVQSEQMIFLPNEDVKGNGQILEQDIQALLEHKPTVKILTSMLNLRHHMFFQPKKQHKQNVTVTRNRHSYTVQIN